MALAGIDGRPFVDLGALADDATLDALHIEITYALARLPTRYTGGSHRSLGISPPGTTDERPDYGEVIASLDDTQFLLFASLGDPENPIDERDGHVFGEDGDVPLTLAQMRWLELAHDVYFPWKVYLDLTHTTGRWADKAEPAPFTREAMLYFPRTVAFLEQLPFAQRGTVKLLGLMPGDDGTVHRDGDPARQTHIDTFITLCPGRPKRLFLWDEQTGARHEAPSRVYWFNDHDWHGVAADPWFRYSLRVDGVFDPDFARSVRP
ncbi:MAG: hypothetical protein R3F61_13880 [Myxococcota bacterium]